MVNKFYLYKMVLLNNDLIFPPVEMADIDGIHAIGGNLSTERLLLAYRSGILPWYNEEEPIVWWSPNPRFVLYPEDLKVSRSMQTVLNNGKFRFTTNRSFTAVIQNCKTTYRNNQEGTWILKYELSGKWSRRITDEDRIIYSVTKNAIRIHSLKGHYL